MRTTSRGAGRFLLVGVLVAAVGGATWVLAAEPEKNGKGAKAEKAKPPRTYAFAMSKKPWRQVIVWLADQLDVPFVGSIIPDDTFNFIPPQGRKYTLPEIIDILNVSLSKHKYMLVRKPTSFTIIAADEKLDPSDFPKIPLPDLTDPGKWGKSEMVMVVVPLKSLVAEDFKSEVKAMMGPFGDVVALATSNQLMLRDSAGNLRRIYRTIQDLEKDGSGSSELAYKCVYIKARDAAEKLTQLLGDPREIVRLSQPQAPRGFGPQFQQQPQAQPAVKVRMHYISSDDRTNTVLVSGPADVVAKAKSFLEKLDKGEKGQQPVFIGQPFLKTYKVQAGNAEALTKVLQGIFKPSNSLGITATSATTIAVWAGPQDQVDIEKQINGHVPDKDNKPVKIHLSVLDSAKTVEILKEMFPDHKNNNPYIGGDQNDNAVVVKGSDDQIKDVRAALDAMGEKTGAAEGSKGERVITLDKGDSASTLAEELGRLLPELLKNPVKVMTPTGEEIKPRPKKKSEDDEDKESRRKDRRRSRRTMVSTEWKPNRDRPVQLVQARRPLEDPQDERDRRERNKRGNASKPIVIMAAGNRLVIKTDDPEALAMINQLVRLMTRTPGEGDFQYIQLKYADATETAKVLDELFNGTKAQTNNQQQPFGRFGGFGGFGGRFGGFGQQQQTTQPTEPKIRVVADPQTNALLVKGNPLAVLTVKRLLRDVLDVAPKDSKANAVKAQPPIKLNNAAAADVAETIEKVYRQYTDLNDTTNARGPAAIFRALGPSRNVDAQGNPRGVTLTISVDATSNTVIVACPDAMFKEIKKLAEKLDEYAKDDKKTMQAITIKDVDPALIKQALDALQGRQPTTINGGGFGGQNNGFRGRGGFGGQRARTGDRPPGDSPGGGQRRGRDFFAYGVKDDPQQTLLYDPQQSDGEPSEPAQERAADGSVKPEALITSVNGQEVAILSPEGGESAPTALGGGEEQQPPAEQGALRNFKGPVQADVVGPVLILRAATKADLEAAVALARYIESLAAGANIEIQVVPLQYADATSVANTLTNMFRSVIVGVSGNTRAPLTQQPAQPQQQQQPNQPQQQFNQQQLQQARQQQQQQQLASVTLLPLARLNAILTAAPRSRMRDIIKEIKRLDVRTAPQADMFPFALKHTSAVKVGNLINQLYATRYPNDVNQVRVSYDDASNTLFIQAAPADLANIRKLIAWMEDNVSKVEEDVRLVHLNNALAEDLAALILRALSTGVSPTSATGPGVFATPAPATPGGAGGGFGGAAGGAGGAGGGFAGAGGGLGGAVGAGGGAAGAQTGTGTGVPTKAMSLRFYTRRPDSPNVFQSGRLDDIHVTPDVRTNSLIVAAPEETMPLVLALIKELDVVPAARAEINIFGLKKSDATTMATMLQQLFLGTGGVGAQRAATPAGGIAGGIPGGPGGGFGGAPVAPVAPVAPTGITGGAAGQVRPLQLTLGQTTPEGAPLIELRITVDERTNSLIVAGSRNDLDVIEAMISRLEDSEVQTRRNEVYHLRNAVAADVAAALNSFLPQALAVYTSAGQLTPFQELLRAVVVAYEPISNALLISATPQYFPEVMRIIQELDQQPPQVMIQVLIAEVDLSGDEEFGVEIGLQSPVLFQRGIFPFVFGAGDTATITTPATGSGLVQPGVTVNSSVQQTALPGFNFNTTAPLGNNPMVAPGVVGFQGLTNLGTGRASATNGLGGFVFQASSDTFNLLIRALKVQGRIDILSRPQVMALNNQTAFIQVGQRVPYVSNTTISALGNVINTVAYQNTGVIMSVTPQINPDGTVLMRVDPQVSSVAPSTVSLGNGVTAVAFNIQEVQTTVVAGDGETVALGGLITSNHTKTENKVPWLGDLPYLGTLFRFRQETKSKTELMVILTPHIVRSRAEADRILAEESRRMQWCLGDVLNIHGTSGMEPIMPPPRSSPAGPGPDIILPGLNGPVQPEAPTTEPPRQRDNREELPPPRSATPSAASLAPATNDAIPVHYSVPVPPPEAGAAPVQGNTNVPAPQQRKESRKWDFWEQR